MMIDSSFMAVRREQDVVERMDPEALALVAAELTKAVSRTAHIATTLVIQHVLPEGALVPLQNLQLSLEQLNYFIDCANAKKAP